jgi:hypothetical protein
MLVEDAVVTLQDLWPEVLDDVAFLGGTFDTAVQVFGEGARADKVCMLACLSLCSFNTSTPYAGEHVYPFEGVRTCLPVRDCSSATPFTAHASSFSTFMHIDVLHGACDERVAEQQSRPLLQALLTAASRQNQQPEGSAGQPRKQAMLAISACDDSTSIFKSKEARPAPVLFIILAPLLPITCGLHAMDHRHTAAA